MLPIHLLDSIIVSHLDISQSAAPNAVRPTAPVDKCTPGHSSSVDALQNNRHVLRPWNQPLCQARFRCTNYTCRVFSCQTSSNSSRLRNTLEPQCLSTLSCFEWNAFQQSPPLGFTVWVVYQIRDHRCFRRVTRGDKSHPFWARPDYWRCEFLLGDYPAFGDLFVYVHTHWHMHCIYTYTSMHLYVYMSIYIYTYASLCIHWCKNTCIYIFIYMHKIFAQGEVSTPSEHNFQRASWLSQVTGCGQGPLLLLAYCVRYCIGTLLLTLKNLIFLVSIALVSFVWVVSCLILGCPFAVLQVMF